MEQKKICVIGGGTGSFVVLSGLKQYPENKLTAIVTATDSGGSTGRLRDEFGYLPIGDVRQCLVALAEDEEEQMMLRDLFSFRFDKGEDGLKGHNFGNLLLTALSEIYGGQVEAIKRVRKLLNIKGSVFPVTLEDAELVAEYENGEELIGEHEIDEPPYPHDCRIRIESLSTKPKVKTYRQVKDSIMNSDLLIFGPGDIYASILANVVVGGVSEAIQASKGKLVYVVNLVTKFGQTFNFSAADHVKEIEKYTGREIDYVLINNRELPENILKKYALQNDYPVEDDMGDDSRVIRADMLASEEIKTPKGDVIHRSFIRHDRRKLAEAIMNL